MMLTIFGLMLFVTSLSTGAWDNLKEREDFLAGKAPFFELPCMNVGGTCAKMNACPPGTKVAQMGLCPEQQQYGIECCRPLKGVTECRSRLGKCVPKSLKCFPEVRDATGCGLREVCCYRVKSEYNK